VIEFIRKGKGMPDNIVATGEPEALGVSRAGLARISDVLRRDVDSKLLPGAVWLVARGEQVAACEAVGVQDPATGAPMRQDSIFRIYSMTKPIVSIALMKLVEEGRLKLDSSVAEFIPEFAEPSVAVLRHGKLDRVPAERPITIQDLLRHTSGLTYDFVATGELGQLYQEAGLRDRTQTLEQLCAKLAALPLRHQPGTRWSYSYSTDVVGRVVEVVSGQPLSAALKDAVLDPLGMTDTGFHVPASEVRRTAEAFPTDPQTGDAVSLIDHKIEPVLQMGGGGLASTIGDYYRFCRMLAAGGTVDGQRIIGRATLAFMASNHLGPDIGIDQDMELLPPGYGFGLGFAVRQEQGRARFPGSIGDFYWGGIAGTAFWIDPKEDLVAVLLIQAPGQRRHYRHLFRALVYAALI
jgi:CubicO group peptidase (beta-lactamase class C family)